jgi:hypothetical protein
VAQSEIPTDTYVVRFWVVIDGYWKFMEETVTLNGKDKHKEAERLVAKKYKSQDFKIVSVIYQ